MGTRQRPKVLVAGASHQGEVVLDLLRRLDGPPDIVAVLDVGDEGRFIGTTVAGFPVETTIADLKRFRGQVDGLIPAVGSAHEREQIARSAEDADIALVSAIDPSAVLATDVEVGPGSVICAGAVMGVGAKIETAVIVNTGAIVEHHCHIGSFAHIAPGVKLAGGISVGRRAWIGIGATILEDLVIGEDAIVGAGALVTKDVAPTTTVMGVPARERDTAGIDSND
jgi:sugar O-acyltransferase (sialic acid O-acetyltransferase NeuD family)